MAHVKLNDISVTFPIYGADAQTLRGSVLGRMTGGRISVSHSRVTVLALQNVSLEARDGDRIAVIGRNGAGKSTLLRVIAGVYPQSSGTLEIEGTRSPMFNLMLGMSMDSTGYENIFICGQLWGMTLQQIREKWDYIVDFCELGDYLSMPVRTYSNGMQARLAFSIATARDPDILLLDEGIGAGDASFHTKAFARIRELAGSSSLLIIALHSIHALRLMCNKALWLDHGEVVAFGDLEPVLGAYEASLKEGEDTKPAAAPAPQAIKA